MPPDPKTDPPPKDYRLGVLFVHGIGSQTEGDTLVRFGEPIRNWIVRWINGARDKDNAAEDTVTLSDVTLHPKSDAPAHATLDVKIPQTHGGAPHRWLFAESWWANSFMTPSYKQLALWAFLVLPWTVATHFGTRLRRAWLDLKSDDKHRRVLTGLGVLLGQMLAFFVGLVLIPIAVSVMMILFLIGLVPIPQLRSFVAKAQGVMASTVGDSFILLESPIQRAAILGRVRHDLKWLLARCDKVAVVAHSQGAAIAHAALRDQPKSNVKLLITLGSGLNKLAEIERIRRAANWWTAWLPPMGMLLLAISGRAVLKALRGVEVEALLGFAGMYALSVLATMPILSSKNAKKNRWLVALRVVIGLAGFALGAAFFFWPIFNNAGVLAYVCLIGFYLLVVGAATVVKEGLHEATLKLPEHIDWVDWYASEDPVPNGRLVDAMTIPRSPHKPLMKDQAEVYNRADFLTDHVAYWQNTDEFVTHVTCELASVVGIDLKNVAPWDGERIEVAKKRRKWRVQWLAGARLAVTAATVAVIATLWRHIPDAWPAKPASWSKLPTLDEADSAAAPLLHAAWRAAEAVLGLWERVPWLGREVTPADMPSTPQVIVSLVTVAIGVIAYYLLYSLWQWWNARDVGVFFRRENTGSATLSYPLFVVALCVVIELSAFVAFGWTEGIVRGVVLMALVAGGTTVMFHPTLRSLDLRGMLVRYAFVFLLMAPAAVRGATLFPKDPKSELFFSETIGDTTGAIMLLCGIGLYAIYRIISATAWGDSIARDFRYASHTVPVAVAAAQAQSSHVKSNAVLDRRKQELEHESKQLTARLDKLKQDSKGHKVAGGIAEQLKNIESQQTQLGLEASQITRFRTSSEEEA